MLRGRGELLVLGTVDVDLPQVVERRFLCDARRCIEWSGKSPLVDRSCCCRYQVPVTTHDRQRILDHIDEILPHLPEDHRLHDPSSSPFMIDEGFSFNLIDDNPLGGCEFNLYRDGRCLCLLHQQALARGEDPCAWKPLACSLWPLAVSDYSDDGEERFLLTIYCPQTTDLFEETDTDPFACLEDQDPAYPSLYQSERPALEYLFGREFWRQLDEAAQPWLSHRASVGQALDRRSISPRT